MSNKPVIFEDEGFNSFEELLKNYSSKVDNSKVDKALEVGAKEFVNDLMKLPKPISEINKSGYTHLIRSFAYEIKKHQAVVGWGKYYGPMVENGTRKMRAQPHLKPTFNSNKNKYYRAMINTLGF